MNRFARFADKHSGQLITRGDFTPATTITPRMQQVMSKKHRWGIHFNMDTFDGICFVAAHYAIPSAVPAPAATQFNIPNIDFNNIVDDAHDCHVEIAYINAFHETGFCLWPSEIVSSMYTLDGTHVNPFNNQDTYNVGSHADRNIVAKFCSTMRKEGIEPWLYVNLSAHWNMLRSMSGASSVHPSAATNQRREWVLYVCLLCQELLIKYGKYGLKGLWVDAYDVLTRAEYQQLYNAIKSIDEDCWVTMNMGAVNGMHNFPGDGQSYEGFVVVDHPEVTQYQSIDTVVDTITYKIPKEFITSLATLTSPQNWYYYDAFCDKQPLNPAGLWLDQSTLQGIYDDAMTYNCAFMTSPSLNRYGRIPAGMLDALKALDYSL